MYDLVVLLGDLIMELGDLVSDMMCIEKQMYNIMWREIE